MRARHCASSVLISEFGFGQSLERCIAEIRHCAPKGTEILTVPAIGNRADALNEAMRSSSGEVLFFVPSFVDVTADLFPAYLAHLNESEASGMVYGDYGITVRPGEVVTQTPLASECDLSEWSTVGYVTAVRRSAFASVGGYDSSYNFAEEYDLRLRLTRRFALERVAKPLYGIDKASVPFNDERVKTALRSFFTPESSAKRGYGYLFNRLEEAAEIERAFESELRARDAFLDGDTRALDCPHDRVGPMVTVVIPVYNRAAYVCRALESVLKGTFRDFEIIVVDGGSTDGTVESVLEFERRSTNVRLLHDSSNKIARSLNIAVKAASGKYVAQLDSDDEYTPTTLETMVAQLEANPEWALAISYYSVIDADSQPLSELGVIQHLEYDQNTLLRTNGAGHVRTWHRCVLESLGGFDEQQFPDYAEDYDMVLRLSEQYAVGRVHEALYRWRKHASNNEQHLCTEYRAGRKALARSLALRRRTENGLVSTLSERYSSE